MKKLLLSVSLLLLWANASQANDTLIRIICSSQDSGAKIFVNGSYKGNCSTDGPVDVFIPAGSTRVEAKKMPDAEHEQVFSEQVTAIAGVPKKVKVVLSEPQLTQAAREARDKATFAAALESAEGGDIAAMAKVADLYDSGTGVHRDPQQASSWRSKIEEINAAKELKAAEGGDLNAMGKVAERYKTGKGLTRNSKKSMEWLDKQYKLKEEARLREETKQRQEEAVRRKKAMEKKLEQASYLKNFKQATREMASKSDPIEGLISATFSPLCLPFDLISTPSRMMERHDIKKRNEEHAGAWAKPDSMLAKAYRQPYGKKKADPLVLYAALQ